MKLTNYITENDKKSVMILCVDGQHCNYVRERIENEYKKLQYTSKKIIIINRNEIVFSNNSRIKLVTPKSIHCSMRGCTIDIILITTYAADYDQEILYDVMPALKGEIHLYEP